MRLQPKEYMKENTYFGTVYSSPRLLALARPSEVREPKRGNDLKRWIQYEGESYHSTTLATWINQVGSERAFVSSISRNEFWTSREPNTKSNNLLHGRDQLPPLPTHIHQLPLYPNPQGNVAPTFAKFTKCTQTSIQIALQKRTLNLKTIRFKCELPYQKNSGRLQKGVWNKLCGDPRIRCAGGQRERDMTPLSPPMWIMVLLHLQDSLILHVILKHTSRKLEGPLKNIASFQRWPPWMGTGADKPACT